MIFQFLKNDKIFFFSMEFHVNWLLKVLALNVPDIGKMVFFEPRSWRKDDIYWLLKSFCFELFGDPKEGLFLEPKVLGKRIFTDCWKVLVLNFFEMGNTVFFWAKKLMGTWYLLGVFELSMIFEDLGNTVFRAVFIIIYCKKKLTI